MSQSAVYVSEYSIYPHRTVYVPTVYVSTVQFMSEVYSSFPMTTDYVPRVQFMFPEYSLCPKSTVHFP